MKKTITIIGFLIIAILLFIPSISNATTENLYATEEELMQVGNFKYKILTDTTVAVYGKHIIEVHNGGMSWKTENVDSITQVNIPSNVQINGKTYTVTAIGNGAFSNCKKLKSVTIPNTIITFGERIFSDDKNFQEVTINSKTIAKSLFYYCSSLKKVTISNNVKSIEDSAFAYCSNLANITIPDSVTNIGKSAFAHCSSLTSVAMPNNIKTIEDNTFNFCTNLTNITIPSNVTTIKGYAFGGCTNLTNVTIPNSVTTIGNNTFAGCEGLKNIIIPNSVKSIEAYAFAECTGLKNITIPSSITTITSYTFAACSSLEKVTIQNGVKYINDKAFYQCENLTNVTIPKSVERIASTTFDNSNKVVINTYKGTTGETFAKTNAIPYVLLESTTDPAPNPANNTKVGYVSIAGTDISLAGNEIKNNENVYIEMAEVLKNKGYNNVFCAYELQATGKIENGVELTFDVGTQNNGKKVMILHKKSNREYEEFTKIVENGQVKIVVEEFSPFMVAIKDNDENAEIVTNENNNINKNRVLDNEPKTNVIDYVAFASFIAVVSLTGIVVEKYRK